MRVLWELFDWSDLFSYNITSQQIEFDFLRKSYSYISLKENNSWNSYVLYKSTNVLEIWNCSKFSNSSKGTTFILMGTVKILKNIKEREGS